jgi:REP element-mobilizing transposase RayT
VSSVVRGRVTLLADPLNAQSVVDSLQFQRTDRAYLLAYAVMPDHFHAVLVPQYPRTISQVMQSVKGYAARIMNARSGVRGSVWQQSFYDRMIRDEPQLFETIEYVHMNPVVAGLAKDAEAYEFSSAGRPESVDLEAFYQG